jgi:hypothetical protein
MNVPKKYKMELKGMFHQIMKKMDFLEIKEKEQKIHYIEKEKTVNAIQLFEIYCYAYKKFFF